MPYFQLTFSLPCALIKNLYNTKFSTNDDYNWDVYLLKYDYWEYTDWQPSFSIYTLAIDLSSNHHPTAILRTTIILLSDQHLPSFNLFGLSSVMKRFSNNSFSHFDGKLFPINIFVGRVIIKVSKQKKQVLKEIFLA